MGVIKVGTSSWADQSLLRSGWYPRSANTPARRLGFYASQFPLVEVDTSYYAIPVPETTQGWVDATPDDFTFDVKAFSLFTGHPTPVAVLPRDLRPAAGPSRIRRRDLPERAYDELWARFRAALDPIAAAGKLGVVMLQFPPWLVRSPAAERRIVELAQRCRPWRVAVELRHGSWLDDDRRDGHSGPVTRPRPVPGLRRHAAGAPVVGAADPDHDGGAGDRPVPRSQRRLGRGRQAGEVPVRVRRGRAAALGRTAGRVRRPPDELHVLFNNCCAGQAQRDATRLAQLLAETMVADHAVPATG